MVSILWTTLANAFPSYQNVWIVNEKLLKYVVCFLIVQHCFRWWLGAIQTQAITWTSDDTEACDTKWNKSTVRPIRKRIHFAVNIFKCIFLNGDVWIWLKFHWSLFLRVQWRIFLALVQIMAWCWPGDKPLSEAMMVRLLTYICVTWPQWVQILQSKSDFYHVI